ncbi:hypothetical protein [Stenotrophobium rhamnosiphilum]|nr:hypothetical protein [Stenotrophobium rhamnosiphilum]
MKNIRGCAPYSTTYHPDKDPRKATYWPLLLDFAKSLDDWRISDKMILFRDMFPAALDSRKMRVLFSLLRVAVTEIYGDQRASLSAPVTPERKDLGFPLHADLFLSSKLWLIFDDVPDDKSGASLFMSRQNLLHLLKKQPKFPVSALKDVRQLMCGKVSRDSFDKLFRILHGGANEWSDELSLSLQKAAMKIRLRRGEGYLMDDRRWLHGRDAATRPVAAWRFHRLTFGPIEI